MTVEELMRTDEGRQQIAALAVKAEQLELYGSIGLFLAAGESVAKALAELIDITTRLEKTRDPQDALIQRLAVKSVAFAREWQQREYETLLAAVNFAQSNHQETTCSE